MENIVLGCTHYPLIEKEIEEVLGKVEFFNGAPYLAKHLKEILKEENMINESHIKNDIQFIDSSKDEKKKKRFFEIINNNMLLQP